MDERKYLDVIEVTERVERGGLLLDSRIGPDWPNRLSLESLRMLSQCNCVAGQLVGDYYSAMERWFDEFPGDLEMPESVAHGFDLAGAEDCEDNWDMLQSAWVGLITVRRSREKASV